MTVVRSTVLFRMVCREQFLIFDTYKFYHTGLVTCLGIQLRLQQFGISYLPVRQMLTQHNADSKITISLNIYFLYC